MEMKKMKYWTLLFFLFIFLKSYAQDSTFFNTVFTQLKLDETKVYSELIVAKVRPDNPKETIMFIPEIVEEDEDYLEFNPYILIVNNESGKIINLYFDRSGWTSDAIILSEIKIDTAPYYVSENNRAFGIRTYYRSMSQPNPYNNATISLFVKSEDTLKEILNNYDVMNYSGEWDTRCAGEFVEEEKKLKIMTNKTKDCYDILVENKITEIKSYVDEDGECDAKEEISTHNIMLKFNGEEYTKNGVIRPLDVYLNDPDINGTNIRQEPNGKVIQKLNEADDYFTLTITEANNGWFKLVKITGVEGNNIEVFEGVGWIHHSVIEASTRRKIELLDAPGSRVVVGMIEQEIGVRIKNKYMDWVQIEYNGLTGWIEAEWICGNPVTTCP